MKIIDSILTDAASIAAIRKDIHAHPELCFKEERTADVVAKQLTDWGIPIHRGMGTTGVIGIVHGRDGGACGRGVGLRADIDALPMQEFNTFAHASKHAGKMHACGHDGHTAMLLAAAKHFSKHRDFDGTVYLIFQPAEEGGGGKIMMARKGAFDGVTASMMIHPADTELARMNAIAIQHCLVRYVGEAAHAAVSPHKGRNALDAAVLGYMNIAALRQHILPTERIHGIFLNGGEKPNIVPRESTMDWYVRSDTIKSLQPLKKRVASCLEGSAVATGCQAELDWQPNPYADIVDNMPLLSAYISNAAQFGRMMTTDFLPGTGGGSTDMGNISYVTPSIHPMIAVSPKGVSLHTPDFADYAIGEPAMKAILDGAKIMAMTTIDMWTNEALRAEVAAAFGDGAIPEDVL